MGVRHTAQVKQQQCIQLDNKKICFSSFNFKGLLEHQSKGQIQNWIVELSGMPELLVMKVIPKLQLYNQKKIKAYIKELFFMVSLQGPFYIQPYYAFQDTYNLYLVLEFISGGDLKTQLKSQLMKESQAKIMVAQILIGLQFLHQHSIIHTGLNPCNIFIDQNGNAKLYGLNQSCKSGDFKIEEDITEYMAPEVLLRQDISFEADYYSIGVILYEIMAQKKMYEYNSLEQLINCILNQQALVKKSALTEDWSLDAADFINKLIQKDPTTRLGFYGFQELKKHPWMEGIPWQRIEERTQSNTFIPKQIQYVRSTQKQQPMKHPMLDSLDFQNLFSLYQYRWDEEVKDLDYQKFI